MSMSQRIRLRHTRAPAQVSRRELNQVQEPAKRWERAIPRVQTAVHLSARFPRRSAEMTEVGVVRVVRRLQTFAARLVGQFPLRCLFIGNCVAMRCSGVL